MKGRLRRFWGVPEEVRVVELMPLGYPSDSTVAKKNRLPFKEIVKYENW